MDPVIIYMLVMTTVLLGGLYYLFHNLNKKYKEDVENERLNSTPKTP